MRRFWTVALLALTLALASPAAARAADMHVAEGGDDAAGTGSPLSPFATVQKAVDAASASGGGAVYVGPGTFAGAVTLRNGVSLFGAGAHETTLTATGASVIVLNGLGTGETIAGFTITGGSALSGGGISCVNSSPVIRDNAIVDNVARMGSVSWQSPYGGGVYVSGGSPTIVNNVIAGNRVVGSDAAGGGLYLRETSATVRGNTITGNTAGPAAAGSGTSRGGGIYCLGGSVTIADNVIDGNAVTGEYVVGGGVVLETGAPQVTGNAVVGNSAISSAYGSAEGGGVYLSRTSGTVRGNTIADNVVRGFSASGGGISFSSGWDRYTPTIAGNIVTGNSVASEDSRGLGGGISSSDGSPSITGNMISGNSASGEYGGQGGGLYCSAFWDDHVSSPLVVNNIATGNVVSGGYGNGTGAGMCFESSQALVRNNTVVANRGEGGVPVAGGIGVSDFWGKGRPSIVNVIVWGNAGPELAGTGVTYSCVEGGAAGTGNIAADPLFAAADDLRLLPGSPAIDVASSAVAPAADIRGTARPQGAGVDMGAHEHVPTGGDAPVAVADAYDATEEQVLAVHGRGVLANDTASPDDGPLRASVAREPGHGELTLDPRGFFTYTPEADFFGTDTFDYAATDARGGSVTGRVTITVAGTPDPVTLDAIDDKLVTMGSTLAFTVTATDPDLPADTHEFSLGADAPAGAGITADGAFSWTPTAAHGLGTFTFEVAVSDGTSSDSGTFDVTVRAAPMPKPSPGEPVGNGGTSGGGATRTASTGTAASGAAPAAPAATTEGDAAAPATGEPAPGGDAGDADEPARVSAEAVDAEEDAEDSAGFPLWALWVVLALAVVGAIGWLARRGKPRGEAAG